MSEKRFTARRSRIRTACAAATERLFSEEERATPPFLRDFYWPLGLRETLGAPVAKFKRQFGLVAVHRRPERAPFTDREIEDFGEIATHIARAVDLRNRFFALQSTNETKSHALDASAAAVIALDQAGALEYAAQAARELLSRNDGLAFPSRSAGRAGGCRQRPAAKSADDGSAARLVDPIDSA
jgi:GAF domain-containing protein